MDDRFYYRNLKCYEKAEEKIIREIGKMDYYDLSQLPTETMKKEFRQYLEYRGSQVSLATIQSDKTYFKQVCMALQTRKRLPESLTEWNEKSWVMLLKGWMLQNGIKLTRENKSVYGTTHLVEARLIRYLRGILRFLQPEDTRAEPEKDIWELNKLDIPIEENPIYKTNTLNFTGILQDGIREEVKQAVYLHLKYEKLGTVKRELTSLRQFSKYLEDKQPGIQSCSEIDRALLEEYLIHKATNGSSGKGNSDDILKLRSVLESVAR